MAKEQETNIMEKVVQLIDLETELKGFEPKEVDLEPVEDSKPILPESPDRTELSERNGERFHKQNTHKYGFEKKALNGEISLEGVKPDELANNPKLVKKHARKTKKIRQQAKKQTNKEIRQETNELKQEILKNQ